MADQIYNSFYQYKNSYCELCDSIKRVIYPEIYQLKDKSLLNSESAVYMEKARKCAFPISEEAESQIRSVEETVKEKTVKEKTDNNLCNELRDGIKGILYMDISQLEDDCLQDIEIAVYMERTRACAPQMSEEAEKQIESVLQIVQVEGENHISKGTRGGRGRYENKILDYYPFEEMTGWCEKYQQVLFSFNNVDIFWPKSFEKKDISRYGYHKARRINHELSNGMPEDRIMSEMTLGMGLTNSIFVHLKAIETLTELNAYQDIISDICRMPGIKMRMSIADYLFNHLELKQGNVNLEELHNILLSAIPEIDKAFSKCKEDLCHLYDRDEEFNILKENIAEEWKSSIFANPYIERWIAEDAGIGKLEEQYEVIKDYDEKKKNKTI